MAQEESRSISENTRWGIKKRFQRGIAHIPTTYFLGYDSDENGNLVINEKEAEIIRRIYYDFLNGKGTVTVAKELMRDGILTARGNKTWTSDSVYKILTNEKFSGNALLQKTVTIDFLTHKRIRNDGREQQYFIRNHHPAIIPEEDWDAVQQEMKRRSNMFRNPDGKYAQAYSNKSCFSNVLFCAECGQPIVRRRLTSERNGGKFLFTAWQCRTRIHPKKYKEVNCKGRHVWEEALEREFMDLLRQLKEEKDELTRDAHKVIEQYDLSSKEKSRQLNLELQIDKINERVQELSDQGPSRVSSVYEASINHLYYEQELLQAEYDELNERQQESKHMERQLKRLLSFLENMDEEEPVFQEEIFRQVIQRGIITRDYDVTLEFKCGITRKVKATREKMK